MPMIHDNRYKCCIGCPNRHTACSDRCIDYMIAKATKGAESSCCGNGTHTAGEDTPTGGNNGNCYICYPCYHRLQLHCRGMYRRTEHCSRKVCAWVRHIIQPVAGTLRRVLALRRTCCRDVYSGDGVYREKQRGLELYANNRRRNTNRRK